MTATTTVRCDRCDRASISIEPTATRTVADNTAAEAGWTVEQSGPVSVHVCPRCTRTPVATR